MGLIPFNSKGQWDEIKAEVNRKLDTIMEYSPLVRNRLTLMRLRRALKF